MKVCKTKRYAPKGYVAVNRPSAKQCFEAGITVTVAGNNVNSFHIFSGWHLGCTLRPYEVDIPECGLDRYSFDSQVRNFEFYLEPELGRYPVFYIPATSIN